MSLTDRHLGSKMCLELYPGMHNENIHVAVVIDAWGSPPDGIVRGVSDLSAPDTERRA